MRDIGRCSIQMAVGMTARQLDVSKWLCIVPRRPSSQGNIQMPEM